MKSACLASWEFLFGNWLQAKYIGIPVSAMLTSRSDQISRMESRRMAPCVWMKSFHIPCKPATRISHHSCSSILIKVSTRPLNLASFARKAGLASALFLTVLSLMPHRKARFLDNATCPIRRRRSMVRGYGAIV